MGRRKVAAEIARAKGAYIKDPQRENKLAPSADGCVPTMPDYFGPDEISKWNELVADLRSLGILSSECRELMIAYCTAYAGWMKARRAVETTGIVLVQKDADGKTVKVKRNPFSVELHKYRAEMDRLLPEFGMTPSSRNNLVSFSNDRAEDPFARILAHLVDA